VLASEASRLDLLELQAVERTPGHLPPGAAAVRCEVRTPSGATCTVVLGGPLELLKNKVGGL
jgi:hypothetical protein